MTTPYLPGFLDWLQYFWSAHCHSSQLNASSPQNFHTLRHAALKMRHALEDQPLIFWYPKRDGRIASRWICCFCSIVSTMLVYINERIFSFKACSTKRGQAVRLSAAGLANSVLSTCSMSSKWAFNLFANRQDILASRSNLIYVTVRMISSLRAAKYKAAWICSSLKGGKSSMIFCFDIPEASHWRISTTAILVPLTQIRQ